MTDLRAQLLADRELVGVEFCQRYAAVLDRWLGDLYESVATPDAHLALVATGGYGRAELSPESDLDLLLLHEPRAEVDEVAEAIWYPIWDLGLKLGHGVRTVGETLDLARTDLETATSLLDARHLAGDRALTDKLVERARRDWRSNAKTRLVELADSVAERHAAAGEVAFLLEPDLKLGRGGMRDDHALRWAEVAEPGLLEVSAATLQSGYEVLLSARVELHRIVGRRSDVLRLDVQDEVARALGFADADVLMSAIAAAARSIAWVSDSTWHQVRSGRDRRRWRRREPVEEEGVVVDGATVRVSSNANLADPLLALRLAHVAARSKAFIDHDGLRRLRDHTPPLGDPWPSGARELLVALLLTGRPAIRAIEALDQMDLFVRILPEWEPCRAKPQRNAYHRFTVDRHLLETAAEASERSVRVHRKDLLVLAALLHDIGKGYPGDHTEVGVELVGSIGPRMGLDAADCATLQALIEHHLLLPDIATRRDLDDDGTIAHVAERVGDQETVMLLGALTEADSVATGPSAWSSWKEGLVASLVTRTVHVLGGGLASEVVGAPFPTDRHRELLGEARTLIEGDGDELTVVAPDFPGVFSRVAGVLALNGLSVLEANIYGEAGMALEVLRVESNSGESIEWDSVIDQVDQALSRRLALSARVAERSRDYRRRAAMTAHPVEPEVRVDNETSAHATVLELAGPDDVGLLFRLTRAMAEMGLDIVGARVQTLGHDVVDAFYVRDRDGAKITDMAHLREIERALLWAMTNPV